MKKTTRICIFFFCALIITCFDSYAQKADSLSKGTDSAHTALSYVAKMQLFAKRSAKESAADFATDKAVIVQNQVFEQVKKTMQKAKIYLKTGLDTSGTRAELNTIKQDFTVAVDGVLTNKGTAQTFRNLTATSKVLTELLAQANSRKTRLDIYHADLNAFRYQLDSLLSVPALFNFPTDSVVLVRYIQQIKVVAREVHPVDSALKNAGNNVQALLNEANLQAFTLQSGLEEIDLYQKEMASNTLKREFTNLWEPSGQYRPFTEILAQAKDKGFLTLIFYLKNNTGKLFILLFLITGSFVYLRSLKNIYRENELITDDYEGQLVLRYPLMSSLLIVVNLFQFFFFSPPFILSVIFWTIGCISLWVMFRKFITHYWMNVWQIMVVLFLIAAFNNLILQASRTERWFMFALSLFGTIAGVFILYNGQREQLREKLILIAVGFMIALEFASTSFNIFGRYNLSKALLISGYLNVVVGILFLWTLRLINEALFLAFNVYTRQDPKLFYLNFDKVGKKVPGYFYLLLIFGWVVLFGRNFAGFDYIIQPIRDFFSNDRTIGDYTFSINSLLLFVAIMGVAVVISKVVSFFASDKHLPADKSGKNNSQGIGSWLLLVRITILSIGFFLAIAAAGIPVDRITIVLGALGVGIGFGLQTLVNNLVSGLIIAFEKPVNVGDIVDIDGQSGTMKSIGFRSSVISTWDGADVVMPNGDLLNSHLTNWSLGGSRRRVSFVIGVAYDSDLEKARALLMDIISADDRIAKNPASVVQYEQFNNSSIDVKVYFWTKHFSDSYATRSDLIIAITASFKQNGIIIPIPQQDIHIHQADRPENKK